MSRHARPTNHRIETGSGCRDMSVRGAPTDPVLTTASILHSLIVATIAERTRVTASSQGLESNPDPAGEGSGGDYQGQLAMLPGFTTRML